MASKTKDIDSEIDGFRYSVDLAINPPLADSVASKMSGDYFTLKQIKDEDVQFINGEITVVSRNATTVQSNNDPSNYVYGYKDLKKAFLNLVQTAAGNGSTLTGYVLVWDSDKLSHYFRLIPANGKIEVQGANLSWPDGTSTAIPDAWKTMWD